MDRQTAEHFYAWMERSVPEQDQHETEQNIHALLREYPDLILTHTWPEMDRLATRFVTVRQGAV